MNWERVTLFQIYNYFRYQTLSPFKYKIRLDVNIRITQLTFQLIRSHRTAFDVFIIRLNGTLKNAYNCNYIKNIIHLYKKKNAENIWKRQWTWWNSQKNRYCVLFITLLVKALSWTCFLLIEYFLIQHV